MRKYIILPLLFSTLLSSCGDKYNNIESYSLDFIPRKVSFAWITPGTLVKDSFMMNNKLITFYNYKGIYNNTASANKLFISICTSNNELLKNQYCLYGDYSSKDTGIPSIEKQIQTDYTNYARSTKANNTKSSEIVDAALIRMEYRTTGVKSLSITADKTLFGQAPGTTLNKFLEIINYDPDYICGTNKNVLYGRGDKDKPTDIDSWLALKPMAQPTMYLKFTSIPSELPTDVSFTVTMTTDDNQILTYTMPFIHLTK